LADPVRRMAGGVAHGLSDLVATVSGAATLLDDVSRTPGQRAESLASLRRAARDLERLLDRLTTMARTRLEVPSPFDLGDVVREAGDAWTGRLGSDVTLSMDVAPVPLTVRGEREVVADAVDELLANANAAMQLGGHMSLSVGPWEPTDAEAVAWGLSERVAGVEIRVADTGVGVDPSDVPVLFEPFATHDGHGGMGLAAVHAIARLHGGGVSIERGTGGGTVVRMFLPAERAAPPTMSPVADAAGTHVLVVDDEDALRSVVTRILRRLGYTVYAVTGADEALAFAAAHDGAIDLLLTDIAMPHMDGIELAARLREVRPTLALVLMTGFAGAVSEERWAETGDVTVLHKPFAVDDLLSAVRAALATR
jgi:two-component system, cell cycle sensor histidine kinase and response regulator CckA